MLNLYLEPTRVDVISDTLVSFRGQPWTFATKVLCLPHLLGVLAARGPIEALWHTAQALEATPYAGGVDGLLPCLPGLVQDAQEGIEERYGPDHQSELLLTGWSVAAGRFLAWIMRSRDGFEPHPITEAHFSPAAEGYQPPKVTKAPSDGTWVMLCEMQADMLMKESGTFTVGGDVILTQLTRGGIASCKIHRFGNHAAAVEAMDRTMSDAA
jgi:hypothetical protein